MGTFQLLLYFCPPRRTVIYFFKYYQKMRIAVLLLYKQCKELLMRNK